MKEYLTKEWREKAYNDLYTKLSKATAEVDGKKQVFRGELKNDLFADVHVSSKIITRFMWTVSHKTDVLPTTLFSVKKDGNKGVVVERLHSGFYDNNGKHIVGTDLIPFILKASAQYQPKPNKGRSVKSTDVRELPVLSEADRKLGFEVEIGTSLNDLRDISNDALAYFGKDAQMRYDKAKADLDKYNKEVERREKIREDQQKLQDVLELMGMSKEQLEELLHK